MEGCEKHLLISSWILHLLVQLMDQVFFFQGFFPQHLRLPKEGESCLVFSMKFLPSTVGDDLHFFLSFLPRISGEMIQFDDHIFQLGWFNHQLDYIPRPQVTSIFQGHPSKTRPKLQPKQGAPFGFQVCIVSSFSMRRY